MSLNKEPMQIIAVLNDLSGKYGINLCTVPISDVLAILTDEDRERLQEAIQYEPEKM